MVLADKSHSQRHFKPTGNYTKLSHNEVKKSKVLLKMEGKKERDKIGRTSIILHPHVPCQSVTLPIERGSYMNSAAVYLNFYALESLNFKIRSRISCFHKICLGISCFHISGWLAGGCAAGLGWLSPEGTRLTGAAILLVLTAVPLI